MKRLAARHLRRLADAASDLLMPPGCFACGGGRGPEGQGGACDGCYAELALIHEPSCKQCGAPAVDLGGGHASVCGHCPSGETRFDAAVAMGEYRGLLRQLILEAKHPSGDATAAALGRLTWRHARERIERLGADLVVPVPMHWSRRLVRQANSPERIAEEIARGLGVPMAPRLLKRTRRTARQAELSRSGRLPNVRRAFAVRSGYRLHGATILLVDDILTTGSTCSAATTALKRGGAERVAAVVAARSL